MHRTEGANNVVNRFTDGPPATTVNDDWLNAVQEEIVYVIEQAGFALKTASTETLQQLKAAIDLMIAAGVAAGITAGDATSSPTFKSVILAGMTSVERDALPTTNGRIVYNTDDSQFQGYANGAWVNFNLYGAFDESFNVAFDLD